MNVKKYFKKEKFNRGQSMAGLVVGIGLGAVVLLAISHQLKKAAEEDKNAQRRALATSLASLGVSYINSPKFLATLTNDMQDRFSDSDVQKRFKNCLKGIGNPLPAKPCDEEFGQTMQVLDGQTQSFALSGGACPAPADPTIPFEATAACPVLRETEFKISCPSASKCERYEAAINTQIYLSEGKIESFSTNTSFSLAATGHTVDDIKKCENKNDGTKQILLGQKITGEGDAAVSESLCAPFNITRCPANEIHCLPIQDIPFSGIGFQSLRFNGGADPTIILAGKGGQEEFCGMGQSPTSTDMVFLVDTSPAVLDVNKEGDPQALSEIKSSLIDFKSGNEFMTSNTKTSGKKTLKTIPTTTAKVVTSNGSGSSAISTLDTSGNYTLPTSSASSSSKNLAQLIKAAATTSSSTYFPNAQSNPNRRKVLVVMTNAQETKDPSGNSIIGGALKSEWEANIAAAEANNITVMLMPVGSKSKVAMESVASYADDVQTFPDYESLGASGEMFRQLTCSGVDESTSELAASP